MYKFLDNIASPNDVKKLKIVELNILSDEIKSFLIENVMKTGGHLSSNLGTIHLTVAMHKVFTTPKDVIVWDVGHQCYTHKILTGRKENFKNLRKMGGLSGFPSPKESKHDAFVAGHGNTALSAAIGIANAKKIKGETGKVIAIIGDGAFTGGMVYEGMNNIRTLDNLIVILNDNKMSISKNVGSMAQYFTQLRANPHYSNVKKNVETVLNHIPLVGKPLKYGMQSVKSSIRKTLYNSTMFENMGFQYIGAVDGHNIKELCQLFKNCKSTQEAPLFIHALTLKGKGFEPAEENPGEFHGVSGGKIKNYEDPDVSPEVSFSNVVGRHIADLAYKNKNICAITAAMKYGTGLQYFYKEHKDRFFDVGMAEQHAVTFAAGLACSGLKPIVAIYSTFLQRSYDQIIHDVALQNANVLFMIDRAGFVPADGSTHQGIFDVAFLSQINNMVIYSPCNYKEACYWAEQLIKKQGPSAIRYARGAESTILSKLDCSNKEYDMYIENDNKDTLFVTYGSETEEVLLAKDILDKKNIKIDICKLCQIHPLPKELLQDIKDYKKIIFAEEGIKLGGVGEHLLYLLQEDDFTGKYIHIGANSTNLTHAEVKQLREIFGLDANSLAKLV